VRRKGKRAEQETKQERKKTGEGEKAGVGKRGEKRKAKEGEKG